MEKKKDYDIVYVESKVTDVDRNFIGKRASEIYRVDKL